MINLKRFFQPAHHRLSVTKTQRELLEYFIIHKKDFEQWFLLHPQSRIRFQFYYPTAIDFHFDNFRLFTAYFKRGPMDTLQLSELKMSRDNAISICTTSWKPFEEVIVAFLKQLDATNQSILLQKTRALHEYASICTNKPAEAAHQGIYKAGMNPNVAAG